MLEADAFDETLTDRGHPPEDDLEPTSRRLADHFNNEGREALAALARRGWVAAMPNHGFSALDRGYGRYADLLSQLFARVELGVEEIADYSLSREGQPGLLLGVDTGEDATYYWKPTGFRRDRCHPALVERAANETLEQEGCDWRVVTVAADTIVAFGVVPSELEELVRLTFESSDLHREDAPASARALNPREFGDLPKRDV
jgi:hypothetical protein